eukprot:7382596-Prymnesium_polylepis.1
MLLIRRHADGKILKLPCVTSTSLPREYLMMGDVRPHGPSEPTAYISQRNPAKVYNNSGSLSFTNNQPFLLYRDDYRCTHHGDLSNIQPSDRICFCLKQITERDYATFSFSLTNPDEPGSETDEPNKNEPNCRNFHFDDIPAPAPVPVEAVSMSDEDAASQDSEEDQVLRAYFMSGAVGWAPVLTADVTPVPALVITSGEWRSRKRNLPFASGTTYPQSPRGTKRCGKCGRIGHNIRTCSLGHE